MQSAQDFGLNKIFNLSDQVAAITGGGGELCGMMARALAANGVKTAILDLREENAQAVADQINQAGGQAVAIGCDALNRQSIETAADRIESELGPVDILINGAGGNHPQATTKPDLPLFDLPPDAIRKVFDINLLGTMICCQVFGKRMADRGSGNIVNVSSMNAFRPLTRIPAYSAAKASVSNFTQWLAVHMAQEYNPAIRVNAIAPGFFLTEQNRFLLVDKDSGGMTARGQQILDHTPVGRLGSAEELVGALIWLVSPSAAFVTGTIVCIDGGFSAYSGV